MARKSANIVNMINRTNMMLDAQMDHHMDPQQQVGFRKGIAALLESVLHENGVYFGFSYTEKAEVDHTAESFTCKDETRCFYHIHPKLK